MPKRPRPRVALLTLGCAKNLVDSEHTASVLHAAGAEVVHDVHGALVAIVNTCGFIQAAKEESIGVILELAELKKAGRLRALVVTGCLSQRYGQELSRLLPEVDFFVGVQPQEAAEVALRQVGLHRPLLPSHVMLRSRRLTPKAWSYLNIAYGCDNRCAYCAIPLIRGPLRSRPRQELLEEARYLAGQGVRELNVIAQDTTNYGRDIAGRPELHLLLRDLCQVEGLRWIRLLYAHPAHFYGELIDVLAGEEKMCPYVDIPLQHISDRILKAMGRHTRRRQIEQLVETLRERIPGVTLRTTFMVGFPGETEADFEELLQFVREVRFDRVGCFAYSAEEGTPAALMTNQVPPKVREARRKALMEAQQDIAFQLAAKRVGERTLVLMEEGEPLRCESWRGKLRPARSSREAPDVDPLIYVAGRGAPAAGEFVTVDIVQSLGYDCIARVSRSRSKCARGSSR